MQLTVNGQPQTIADGATLESLLTALALAPRRVAVERNGRLVRRTDFAQTPLQEGDCLEILTLVGGG